MKVVSYFTNTQRGTFAREAQDFLKKIISQRARINSLRKGRRDRIETSMAASSLQVYLDNYYYSDKQMAAFLIRHMDTIQEIIPGEGSGSHVKTQDELLKLYSRAVTIQSLNIMKETSYYQVTNDYGEAFVKTSKSSCTVASLTYDSKAEVRCFNSCFKKQNGDIALEISHDDYVKGLTRVIEKIKKDNAIK